MNEGWEKGTSREEIKLPEIKFPPPAAIEQAKANRLRRVRAEMAEKDLEALLVTSPQNIFYLSGFAGTSALLVITAENARLLTDFRYLEQAGRQAPAWECVQVGVKREETAAELLGIAQRIGFEELALNWRDYQVYSGLLPGKSFVEFSEVLSQQRRIKDDVEISLLRAAIELTDRGFAAVCQEIAPGRTEQEIALGLEFCLRQWGAQGPSFDFIVASGPRGAMPHGVAGPRVLMSGDLVTLDFGIKIGGYCSDMTRTVCLGEPTPQQRRIFELVLAAQRAGIEALRPGITGKEADAAARNVIEQAGYGEQFGHGLGHSLGIDIHESPSLNTSDETVLAPGMLITVEPGIYIPGWGGIRIEDVVLITENGAEVLTQSSKEFIIIS